MKKSVEGKRFTKVEVTEHDSLQDMLDHLAGIPFPSATRKITEGRKTAENILSARGLPTTPKTTWTRKNGGKMDGFLDVYIGETSSRDSPEWYAAKIVVACHRLNQAEGKEAVELAFEIGQLLAFARVYQIVSDWSATIGKRSKRSTWADALAYKVCHLSDDEIWWYLTDDEKETQIKIDTWRYDIFISEDPETLKKDIIKAIPFDDTDTPEKPQKLKLSTFLRNYVRPARKKNK